MAESAPKKKPRIRKAPQTMREKAESAQSQAEKPKKQRLSKVKSTAKKPFTRSKKSVAKLNAKRPKLPDNKATRILNTPFRWLRKVLSWLVPRYFINSWKEVKLVTWPSRRETWRLTLAVFIFAIIFGLIAYGVDMVLDKIFKAFVLK